MSDTKQVVHFHKDYESKAYDVLEIVRDFYNKGENVLLNERNSIKSFDLKGEKINIKSFKKPNVFNAFVYKFLRKSKAKRSFEYAQKLIECGISTPFPIAYIEEFSALGLKNSYYISKHIDYDFDFRDLIHQPQFPDRVRILQEFTKFTFKLHENDINFLDHSPGNTLIVKRGNGLYDFYLIDLNRMTFQSMDFDKRMHNFRRLWLSKTMVKIMSETYAKLYNKTYQETHDLMLKYSRYFQCKVDSKKLKKSGRKMRFKS
ncbi:MAG: lipopolysaccharide kinase [Gelidibacter sp.]|nr:lipopolysaccharide kinase [Gelidibacter sp.]